GRLAAASDLPWRARAASRRSFAALRLPATCQLRSSAFGVGPLPSSALRPWPPVPEVAPFLLLRAPGRPGLAISSSPVGVSSREAPARARRRVVDRDAHGGE